MHGERALKAKCKAERLETLHEFQPYGSSQAHNQVIDRSYRSDHTFSKTMRGRPKATSRFQTAHAGLEREANRQLRRTRTAATQVRVAGAHVRSCRGLHVLRPVRNAVLLRSRIKTCY
jgi:hypothetical protein